MKLHLIASIAVASSMLTGAAIEATDFSSRSNGDWDVTSTWDPPGVPGDGDNATVKAGHTVTVDTSEVIDSLTVEDAGAGGSAGSLKLSAGALLEVHVGIDVEDALPTEGRLEFAAASGTAPILKAGAPGVTINGPIDVMGAAGGEFQAQNPATHSWTLVQGGFITCGNAALTISARLENNGQIVAANADAADGITFTEAPDPDSYGLFIVQNHPNARMNFVNNAGVVWTVNNPVLGPFFEVHRGGMIFEVDVTGEAQLRMLNGFITVTGGNSFIATEAWEPTAP